jgi:hypothetical protein
MALSLWWLAIAIAYAVARNLLLEPVLVSAPSPLLRMAPTPFPSHHRHLWIFSHPHFSPLLSIVPMTP